MARCLAPRTIYNPRLRDDPKTFGHETTVLRRYGRDAVRPRLYDTFVVPCGKCLACLKNKQSSMVVRCLREAQRRGSFGFMTLTYDDDHLPLAQSLWAVHLPTGESHLVEGPEFVSTGMHPDPKLCEVFRGMPLSEHPRYKRWEILRDGEFSYEARITPSVCRSDVRTWLKMARIQYEREHGVKLPSFSYVAISEYGPRTCRPHYHLAFFGLGRSHLDWLLERWTFGLVKQVRMVAMVNKDNSSGFIRASKYIGKYMSKGKFEAECVKCGAAERPRVCQSVGLGCDSIEPLRRFVLCWDMVGEYDPFTLCRPDGTPLGRDVVDKLVSQIPERLVYHVDELTTLPLPRLLRERVFRKKLFPDDAQKTVSPLWLMVADALRDVSVRARDERLRSFLANRYEGASYKDLAEFAEFEAFNCSLQETSLQKDLQRFYSGSHF